MSLALDRIGVGTAALAYLYQPVSESIAEATLERAFAAGLRFFDTAHLYGGGLAEERLGRVLARHPRASYQVATKIGIYRPHGQGPIPPGSTVRRAADVWDYGYDRTLEAVDTSLVRLKLDRIDIVHVHGPDGYLEAAAEGSYRALARLKDQGVIGAIGAGCDTVTGLIEVAKRVPLDAMLSAGRLTLLDQEARTSLLPLAKAKRIRLFVAGVFNSGILATGATDGARYDYSAAGAAIRDRAAALAALCGRFDVPLRRAALHFPLRFDCVDRLLLGPASAAKLEDSLAQLSRPVPEALWSSLGEAGLIAGGPP